MFHQNPNIFDILFEAIPEGVIVVNDQQQITATNTSSEEMFGYSKGELINQSLNILIPKRFHFSHADYFKLYIQKNTPRKIGNGRVLKGITKQNKEFPVEIGLNPFKVDGKDYIIAIIIDSTERQESQRKIKLLNSQLELRIKLRTAELQNTIKQLKELNKNYKVEISKRIKAEDKLKDALKKEQELNELKTKFLSMVSHEFKTPLSGILSSAILLGKYQLENQQQNRDKHINTVVSKVHYLNNIINDFLSIERLDSNHVNYQITTFNLSKIVNEVVYNSNMLLKSGQKIKIPENTDEFILSQDERFLELALTNIINNSIKYSPHNTTIDLDIYSKNKFIYFKISDTGIGIPEKDQKFIFKRYFRAENVLNNQGTGIGLNIVKSHIENLGGSIYFESKENIGSTFTFNLPITLEL